MKFILIFLGTILTYESAELMIPRLGDILLGIIIVLIGFTWK